MYQISGQFGKTELINTVKHLAMVGGVAAVYAILEYLKNQNYGDFTVFVIPVITTLMTAVQQKNTGLSE